MMLKTTLFFCFLLVVAFALAQGPYAPPVGNNGTTAMHKDSSKFVAWASACSIDRGFQDISNTSLGYANVGTSAAAVGKSGANGIVSLGDGGRATLTFDAPIKNGVGADFAIFENSFSDDFLELAFVEVSSDGIHFFRFDAVSLTDTSTQTPSFGLTDATQLYNLAGKYRGSYGTPFDLDELAGTTGLDINNITHIKIIDVVGSIDPAYATYDSQNNKVNDPWPTDFGASGFDLDAVGIIHSTATAISTAKNENAITLFPNPFKNWLNIKTTQNEWQHYKILNFQGKTIEEGSFKNESHQINLNHLEEGVYFFQLSTYGRQDNTKNTVVNQKIIKH